MSGPKRCPECLNGRVPNKLAFTMCRIYENVMYPQCGYCKVGLTKLVMAKLDRKTYLIREDLNAT
jgi:hypothetical protein